MIRVSGIVRGHYECRSLQQTLPILRELLALEVVSQTTGAATVRHPNTDWLLVIHEIVDAPNKPHPHHYGVRVATDQEVDNAYEYLKSRKTELSLKIVPPETRRIAHSVHFVEPGGNFWEIESYEGGAKKHGLSSEIAFPWPRAIVDDPFPDRGYVPQCLSHGTTSCVNLDRARRFYRHALGLEVMHHFPTVDPYYIKHPATPWYIVCLPTPAAARVPTGVRERFTLAVQSADEVSRAHRWLKENAADFNIGEPGAVCEEPGSLSFLFTDPDSNYWEITGARV